MPPKAGKGGKPAGAVVKKKEKEEKLKPWEEQNESEQQSTVAKAREQLGSLGLTGIELVVSKETQYPRGEVNNIFGVVGSVTSKHEKKLEKFAKVFNDVASKFDVAMTSFGPGDKVPEAEVFDFENNNVDLFDDKECQIVILLFWAPWVPGYQEALKRVYKLAETHGEEWSGKVAFVNVAIDGSIESAQKELANLKLDSKHITNYWGGDDEDEGDENSAVAKYDIQHLPDLLIINNVGQLVKRTDPTEINVERVVTKLLAGETVNDADFELPKKSKKGSWNDYPEDKRSEIVSHASDLISKTGGELEGVLLVTSDSRIIQISGSEKQERSLLLLGKIEQKAEAALLSVIKYIESQGVTDLNKLVMVSPAPADIKPTPKCSNCSQPFLKAGSKGAAKSPAAGSNKGKQAAGSKKRGSQKGGKGGKQDNKAQDKAQEASGAPGDKWHCAVCVQPYTLCEDCELGRVKSKCHPDYHIYYRIPAGYNEANLATVEYGIGSFNVMMGKQQPEDEEPAPVVHEQVFCNGCPEGKGHIQGQDRYKCAHCADFDFCGSCYKELLADGNKHDKDHLFVRIADSEFVTIEGDDDEGDEMDDIDPDEYEKVMAQLKDHNLEDDFIDGEELGENGEPKIAVMDDDDEEEAPKPKGKGAAAKGKGGKKDQCCDHDHDHDHAHGGPKKGGKADKKPAAAAPPAEKPKAEPQAEPKAESKKADTKAKAEAKPATSNKGAAPASNKGAAPANNKGAAPANNKGAAAPASNKGAAPKEEKPKSTAAPGSNKGKPAPAKTEEKKGAKKADAPAPAPALAAKVDSKKGAAPAAAPAKADSQKAAAPKKGAAGKGKPAKSKVEQAVSVPLPDDD